MLGKIQLFKVSVNARAERDEEGKETNEKKRKKRRKTPHLRASASSLLIFEERFARICVCVSDSYLIK